MRNIDHITHLASFVARVGSIVQAATEDGKVTLWELLGFLPLLKDVGGAFEDVREAPAELLDLSEDETRQLLHFIETELADGLPLGTDGAAIALASLQALKPLVNLINACRGRGLPAVEV